MTDEDGGSDWTVPQQDYRHLVTYGNDRRSDERDLKQEVGELVRVQFSSVSKTENSFSLSHILISFAVFIGALETSPPVRQ